MTNTTTIIVAPAEQSLIRIGAVPAWAYWTITIAEPNSKVETFHFERAHDIELVISQFVRACEYGGTQVNVERVSAPAFN